VTGRIPPLALVGVLVLAGLASGCAGGPTSSSLSFAQMQSLNPGVSAGWILEEYPFGRVDRAPNGQVRTVRYDVTDPQGNTQTVTLGFDENEVLARKQYSGPIVRPPPTTNP
jgi:hypothetical protein